MGCCPISRRSCNFLIFLTINSFIHHYLWRASILIHAVCTLAYLNRVGRIRLYDRHTSKGGGHITVNGSTDNDPDRQALRFMCVAHAPPVRAHVRKLKVYECSRCGISPKRGHTCIPKRQHHEARVKEFARIIDVFASPEAQQGVPLAAPHTYVGWDRIPPLPLLHGPDAPTDEDQFAHAAELLAVVDGGMHDAGLAVDTIIVNAERAWALGALRFLRE